jgi:hypothetical protein
LVNGGQGITIMLIITDTFTAFSLIFINILSPVYPSRYLCDGMRRRQGEADAGTSRRMEDIQVA